MDLSVVLTLVRTLVQLLDSPARRDIEFVWGYKSKLKSLSSTMSTIRALLLDLEKQERQQLELSHMLQDKLERLKEALYQADDLFDEVTTLALRKKLMSGNKVSKEVRLFFSKFNQLHSAINMSREMKKIRYILNDIAKDHHDFASRHQNDLEVNRVMNDRETHSFVHEEDIILGRDDDKRIVINTLLNNSADAENVSFVTIVGMGGLGKTTLAQLVYNDEKVKSEFPLKMWVCVSNDFHSKLLRKLLTSVTNQTDHDGLQMDQIQRKLRQELEGKKYLLVLDDVWNEDYNKWHKLKILLMGGGRGSRVIVTTRSKKVAEIVGNLYTYELHGLSDVDSWNLFERMTLEPGQHQLERYMVDIGKDIVRKCANIPLALRVLGSLLQGQDESRWRYLRKTDLKNIKHDENDIVGTLKISYYYLPFHLKSCFSFCAIFPKNYKIKKDSLIRLWMAHGLIMPLDGQSFEDAGEEYFMHLLQRCFFQEVDRAESGEVLSCKMHDLIHDLAMTIAGSEVLLLNNNTSCFDQKIRHLFIHNSVTRNDLREHLTRMNRMRTVMKMSYPWPSKNLDVFLQKSKYLRVLDLHGTSFENLPSNISRLLHLRYLDLSWNQKLSSLPSGITELYNLQTLMLRGCSSLLELPRDLKELVKLRCLDIYDCKSMTHMPPGMGNLTCLHKLTMFLVGKTSNARSVFPASSGGLRDLKHLNNLTGNLEINIRGRLADEEAEAKKGGHLINKQNLRGVNICWTQKLHDLEYNEKDNEGTNAETLLFCLQPHPNLRALELWDYPGVSFPCWGSPSMNLEKCLPNLVEVEFNGGKRLERLPLFSQLRYLKSLELVGLRKLEYIEKNTSGEDELVFFQSLEKLVLGNMQELKGWREETGEDQKREMLTIGRPSFPRLTYLHIWECSNLTSLPLCPKLKKVELIKFNEAMCPITRPINEGTSSASGYSTTNVQLQVSEGLKEVKIDKVGYLNSLPLESFKCLSTVVIRSDHEMERLIPGEAGEVFRSGRFSFLQSLAISNCSKLTSLSGQGVWEHLTALENLQLKLLSKLSLDDDNLGGDNYESDQTDIPWRYVHRTLRSMLLWYLPKLVKLPNGMQYLTSLESLRITNCHNFETLPSWIGCFTSLQSLVVRYCRNLKSLPEEMSHLLSLQHLDLRDCSSELTERCTKITGTDWPKIQHIPLIDVI